MEAQLEKMIRKQFPVDDEVQEPEENYKDSEVL